MGETDSEQDKYINYAAYQMVCAVREVKQVGGMRGTGMSSNSNRGGREGLIELGPSELRHEGGKGGAK